MQKARNDTFSNSQQHPSDAGRPTYCIHCNRAHSPCPVFRIEEAEKVISVPSKHLPEIGIFVAEIESDFYVWHWNAMKLFASLLFAAVLFGSGCSSLRPPAQDKLAWEGG